MPKITITRDENNLLDGLSDKDKRAYAKLKQLLTGLTAHETLILQFRVPRSPGFHRRHFGILRAIFKGQDQFANEDDMRKWSEVGGGYCKEVPGLDGKMVWLPLSIDYDTLDDIEFREVHERVLHFLYSPRAYRYLWPHLSDQKAWDMMDTHIQNWFLVH
jgi:hypothetical protein